MKMTFKILALLICAFVACSAAMAQPCLYPYKRKISGITGTWHKAVLPDEVISKASRNLSDIRIYGAANGDTIEAPYILNVASEKMTATQIPARIINRSKNGNGYFFTIEIPDPSVFNQVSLHFKPDNFDWNLKVEGSHDRTSWFTVAENYRVVAIKNDRTEFQFTDVVLPDMDYPYIRIEIPSDADPQLNGAKVFRSVKTEGIYKDQTVASYQVEHADKKSIIMINLPAVVSVSAVKINIVDLVDYYRPASISWLSDSVKTHNGWKYRFNSATRIVLSSLGQNEFKFENILTNRLKITVENFDSQPLHFGMPVIKGAVHEITARFTDNAEYYLVYGNPAARRPSYDIAYLTGSIPDKIAGMVLGEEEKIEIEEKSVKTPLFQNKVFLWAIIIAFVIGLSWFSIQMIRKG